MPPCKGCESRQVGCHAKCDKYEAYRTEREKLYRKKVEDAKVYDAQHYKKDMMIARKIKHGR